MWELLGNINGVIQCSSYVVVEKQLRCDTAAENLVSNTFSVSFCSRRVFSSVRNPS